MVLSPALPVPDLARQGYNLLAEDCLKMRMHQVPQAVVFLDWGLDQELVAAGQFLHLFLLTQKEIRFASLPVQRR